MIAPSYTYLQVLGSLPQPCKLFYKKECQEKYFTLDRRPVMFSAFSPFRHFTDFFVLTVLAADRRRSQMISR